MRVDFEKLARILATLLLLFPSFVLAGGEHEHADTGVGEKQQHHEEGRAGTVSISDEGIQNAKIELRRAGPGELLLKLSVNGRISPISSNVAHISSRFSGVIREVRKDVGDAVVSGDVLAILESNQNLQKFEVRALKEGVITDLHATIGESVKEDDALFVVMDLSELWADFTVFQRDVSKVKIGQEVEIFSPGRSAPYRSFLSFISPVIDETTQSRIARAVIKSPDENIAPGAFVTGQIALEKFKVPVAVLYTGVQTIDGKAVLFVRNESGFEARAVGVGRTDGTSIEVVSGLQDGEVYATENSFILKAVLGKSEAQHEH